MEATSASLPALFIALPEGIIDLGWGHPSPRLHPLALMQQAAQRAFAQTRTAMLQYGAPQGFGPLLVSLASFLSLQSAYQHTVEPTQLFLTCGASQALDMACTLLTRPGDVVLVEEPTYYLVERIFRDHQLRVLGVPTDADGLCIDALQAQLADPAQPRPALLYTIPAYHNPTGSVLPAVRRQALVDLAQRYRFLIAADEVYHLLYYDTPPPPPLAVFDTSTQGCVLSLGSFSKILSPGLRLGWIQAHPALIQRFVEAGFVASGGGLNHFAATLVHAAIELGLLAENISTLQATYRERLQAFTAALRTYLPDDVRIMVPGGGYFVWLTCGPDIATEALLPYARQAGVGYRPGPAFSATAAFPQAMRLSFALYEVEDLVQGAARLGQAMRVYRQAPGGAL
ncbi:MAG: PLP-dependent aminotransferase family protein [Candidatus Tectimicrobiota bacterium]